jgi:hypothetical protein
MKLTHIKYEVNKRKYIRMKRKKYESITEQTKPGIRKLCKSSSLKQNNVRCATEVFNMAVSSTTRLALATCTMLNNGQKYKLELS